MELPTYGGSLIIGNTESRRQLAREMMIKRLFQQLAEHLAYSAVTERESAESTTYDLQVHIFTPAQLEEYVAHRSLQRSPLARWLTS
jgi:hypothetical protein